MERRFSAAGVIAGVQSGGRAGERGRRAGRARGRAGHSRPKERRGPHHEVQGISEKECKTAKQLPAILRETIA